MAKFEWEKNNKEKLIATRGSEPIGDLATSDETKKNKKLKNTLTPQQIFESRVSEQMREIAGCNNRIAKLKKEISRLQIETEAKAKNILKEEQNIQIRLRILRDLKRRVI